MSIESLATLPPGICVLTAGGELAVLDTQHGLRSLTALTDALAAHLTEFLSTHRANPHAGDRRLAILHRLADAHPWRTATLSLEDRIVRELYPAGGRRRAGLTAFQQRRRHCSLYRGMELMLEYRRENRPDTPVYCPVVYETPVRLGGRASALGRPPAGDEAGTLVLDVLNLAAGGQRLQDQAALRALNAQLYRMLIDKGVRRESSYEFIEFNPETAPPAPAAPVLGDVPDWRLQDDVTLPQVDLYRPHEAERVDRIECWLRVPHQAVRPERLREFVQFRELDEASLNELAARSLLYGAPGGAYLLNPGVSDAWNLYLLDGSVMLTAADGATLRLDGGSPKARFPVSFLKPRKYRVDALSPISFLWIHDMLLAAVHAPRPREPA